MALMAMWRHGLEAIVVMCLMCCPDRKKQVRVSVFVAYKSQKNNLRDYNLEHSPKNCCDVVASSSFIPVSGCIVSWARA
jgi:hypothetical protein